MNAVSKIDFVTEQATSADGMTKKDAALFHYFNPNGARQLLPEFEEFIDGDIFFTGCEMLYGRHDNYHAKRLGEFVSGKRFTWWDLNYHVAGLVADAEDANKTLAEKTGE